MYSDSIVEKLRGIGTVHLTFCVVSIRLMCGLGWEESGIVAVVESCATDTIPNFMIAKKLTNSGTVSFLIDGRG